MRRGRAYGVGVALAMLAGCAPDPTTPAAACDPRHMQVLNRVADYTRTAQPQFDWGWRSGVVLTGMIGAFDCTEDPSIRDYVIDWFEAQFEQGYADYAHVNDAAPGIALLRLWEDTGDTRYLDTALEGGELLRGAYPKIDGALVHAPDQLWVDTTFMTAPFLVELGRVTGEDAYTELGIAQILQHERRLADEAGSGLWRHGWDLAQGQAPVHWGRGNGWATASTAEVLIRLPADHPDRAAVAEALTRLVDAAIDDQSPEGAWRTIIDDETTYLESSGTTMIARGCLVAHQEGLVGDEALDAHDRARDWLVEQVASDGHLQAVSGPTALSWDVDYYRERPTDQPQLYAQGTLALLLSSLR